MKNKTEKEQAAIMAAINDKAAAISAHVMAEVDATSLTDSMDKFRPAWGEMIRFIRDTESENKVLFSGAQAEALCDAANKILDAAFASGYVAFHCFDADGEECAWEDADSAELAADSVSFTIVNKGHYTSWAENLGSEVMGDIAQLCHMPAERYDRDGQSEWLFIEWAK